MPTPSHHKFTLIIPAAGVGSRMASKTAKQYLLLNTKTIIEHTLEVFIAHPLIDNIVVALHPNDETFATLAIAGHSKIHAITGGSQRVDSVLCALQYAKDNFACDTRATHYALVHDAARPCLQITQVDALVTEFLQAKENLQVSGAILASLVVDTVKRARSSKTGSTTSPSQKQNTSQNLIETSVDRSHLWLAQTPQLFEVNALIKAIESNAEQKHLITDEASAMELIGKTVLLVNSPTSNLKVTRPEDLALAEFYLSQFSKHKNNNQDKH
jgi:2-C-methyl-D-erythritol 4-phosphate cytidylyltransferase